MSMEKLGEFLSEIESNGRVSFEGIFVITEPGENGRVRIPMRYDGNIVLTMKRGDSSDAYEVASKGNRFKMVFKARGDWEVVERDDYNEQRIPGPFLSLDINGRAGNVRIYSKEKKE